MTPTIALRADGSPWFALGSPGSATIPNTVFQVIVNIVDSKMSLRDAIEFPRIHHQYLPDEVDYEQGALTDAEIKELQAMGHSLKVSGRQWGNMQVITWDYATGKVDAASDPRGEGVGLVY